MESERDSKSELEREFDGFEFPEQIVIPATKPKPSKPIVLKRQYGPRVGVYYSGELSLPIYEAAIRKKRLRKITPKQCP